MADRYFAVVGEQDAGVAALREVVAADASWYIVLDLAGCLVIAERSTAVMSIANRGVVIGPFCAAETSLCPSALSRDTTSSIISSGGRHFVEGYWGSYVAIMASDAGVVSFIRAPFGVLPCLYCCTGQTHLIASDVALLERFGGQRPRIDWPAVARFLCAPTMRHDETCLLGVNELRGGDRLTLKGSRATFATLWSPWSFATESEQVADRLEAANRLRGAILSAVESSGATAIPSVLMLSGGLDSSAIAAAAARHSLDLVGVNVSTFDLSGDERHYARAVCDQLRVPLEECSFELAGVDLKQSAAALLPRPVARAFEYEARRQARVVAKRVGAKVVLSGGGGDNIFCSLQSVSPLLDCLRSPGGRHEFWRTAREISEICDTSLLTVVGRAWRRSWQRERPQRMDIDVRFLSDMGAAAAATIPQHRWLRRPAHVLPGKAAHVALLLGPQHLAEDADPQADCPLRYPLITQPLIELCLRIPTWLWFDQGCNRAVARRAFEADLPHTVAWRRSKGSPDSFVVDLFETNRSVVSEMLLHGNLARHGLLDTYALTRRLDDHRPSSGSEHGRIMRLVDIEAWTRCWPG